MAMVMDPPGSATDAESLAGPGMPRMTPDVLQQLCEERHMWRQPRLNTQLYLNLRGFVAMECLEEYVNVKALHLDNNLISKIECLERMSELRVMHMSGNRIQQISGLQCNLKVVQLNLSSNALTSLAGIEHLHLLQQLNVSNNAIPDLQSIAAVKVLPALGNLDVSGNQIETETEVVEFFEEMAGQIKSLRYFGNPGVRNIQHYRKRMVNALHELAYFDDRPVFPIERASCKAWKEGGMEAMHKAKQEFHRMRFEQCKVDPDRREMLTRNRRLALERIDREAKEKREAEEAAIDAMKNKPKVTIDSLSPLPAEKELEAQDQAPGQRWVRNACTSTDCKDCNGSGKHGSALKNYLCPKCNGKGKEPDEDVPELKGGSAPSSPAASAPAKSNTNAEQPAPAPQPAPAAQPGLSAGAEASTASADSTFRPPSRNLYRAGGRPPEAADFRAGAGRNRTLHDRQMAVMGEDAWAGTDTRSARAAAPRHLRDEAQAALDRGVANATVVPDIWENKRTSNLLAEMDVSMRNERVVAQMHADATATAARCAEAQGSELHSLD